MARRLMSTMTFDQLHGTGGDGANPPVEGSPSGTGNPKYDAPYTDESEKLPVGESMPNAKIPGQPDAERSGISSPITTASRQEGAFQEESLPNSGRTFDLPSKGVLAPGPNYKVNRTTHPLYQDTDGGPYKGNADELDKKFQKYQSAAAGSIVEHGPQGEPITRENAIEAFKINHPKSNFANVQDDEGNAYDTLPISGNEKDSDVLEQFYKKHEQKAVATK